MAPAAPAVDGSIWISPAPGNGRLDPLPLDTLAGSITIVVFWSAGCEASLHRLRQLEDLLVSRRPDDPAHRAWRQRLSDSTTERVDVLAVHTPRFPHDNEVDTVLGAMRRFRIPFTVVHDPDFVTWNRFNPHGWPSTAVIDASNRLTGMQAGSGQLAVVVEAMLLALESPGLDVDRRRRRTDGDRRRPPVFDHRAGAAGEAPSRITAEHRLHLHYPEGVATLPGGRIVVADTGNDRLLVGDLSRDGATCVLDHPIELFEEPTRLLHAGDARIVVVERGRAKLWLMDLATGRRDLISADLDRPTGCSLDRDGSLVVADPVDNRLHRITREFRMGTIAGSGRCGTIPGPAAEAELAQPVAVGRSSSGLVIVDAATSNLRLLTDDGEVLNVTDNDFYQWGLIDGAAHRARLQRPTDLCLLADDSVLVTDTGNNRLRLLRRRHLHTLGLRGLNRPTAVARLGSERALVTDTGNHRIVAVDLARQRAWTLCFQNMDRMLTRDQRALVSADGPDPDPRFEPAGASGAVSPGTGTGIEAVGHRPAIRVGER